MSTFTLSVLGLVLAVIANLWNFGLALVRWPRIAVETRTHIVLVPGGTNRHRFELTVINRGSEAATISNIGLQPEDPSRNGPNYAHDEVHQPDYLPEGEPLPVRIEGHGVLRWTYTLEQVSALPTGTVVRGYANTYKSFRWPWLKRDALTERTVTARRTEKILG